ncbi:MAG: hypothetical protein AABW65_02365 [Nanoarchaeota archaeon]
MKALIFDSGILINFSMNGILYILEELKKVFPGKFIITNYVKYETIAKPIGIQRFELGALKIQGMLDAGILELPESLNVKEKEIEAGTKELMFIANHCMGAREQWIEIVSEAEMSCLALSKILSERGIENIIGIDERTTRILCEDPMQLERIMSEKLHQKVTLVSDKLDIFSEFKFVRSSEIAYVAYKKNLVHLNGKKVLEALLYATKYKGSAISFEEIDILKKL